MIYRYTIQVEFWKIKMKFELRNFPLEGYHAWEQAGYSGGITEM